MATLHHDRPPTLAEQGTPPPKTTPADDGPGAPARRRRLGLRELGIVLVLAGLSLMLFIAPAGIALAAVGAVVGVWGTLAGKSGTAPAPTRHG